MSTTEPPPPGPATERVRVRRGTRRADYDRGTALAVLDAGLVAHLGVTTPEGPLVLPMAYGRTDEWLYLHGAAANGVLGSAVDHEVCVTVTLLDALVVARSPFHNSMDYRCVVVRGRARRVDDPAERRQALRLVSDHVVPTWDAGRPPTGSELRRTLVVAVPLAEVSVKVRAGGPGDEPEDLDGPHWGGHVPLRTEFGEPVPSPDLPTGVAAPEAVAELAGRTLP